MVNGPTQTRRIESARDLACVLDEVFGLEPPVSADELFERVPKGLATAHLPPAP